MVTLVKGGSTIITLSGCLDLSRAEKSKYTAGLLL